MRISRRSRVTFETERVLMVARGQAVLGWCERCGAEVQLLQSGPRGNALHRMVMRLNRQLPGKAHVLHAKDRLVVCLEPLLRFLQPSPAKRGPEN